MQKKLCLVVDDSKVVRTVSRRIMEEFGFRVVEAEDGKKALEECKKAIPEVVLLDWNMPVMNGPEFLESFRQIKEYSETKIIFCTTENDFAKIQHAIMSGASEYIMKPFNDEIIKNKLMQLGVLE